MKKHHLLILTGLLLFTLSFTPVIHHPTTSDWSEWVSGNCVQGIDYRVKKGDFNNYAKKWYWYVQFRNRYNNTVNFSYSVSEPGTMTNPDHRSRMTGGNLSDATGFLMYSGDKVHVRVGYVRFGDSDSGQYVNCDQ